MTKDTVFAILKNEGAYVSGERISGRLGFESAVQQATQTVIDKDRSLAK